MMTNELPAKRISSYGEQRKFRGLEGFAISRRLQKARILIDKLISQHPNRSLHVLELGCGFWARNLQILSSEFAKVQFTGVDIKVSKPGKESINLIEADLTEWKPNQKYDCVISLAVAEHLLDPRQHFEQIAACLRQSGYAGVTTPTPVADFVLEKLGRLGVFDREEIQDHQMYFTENGLKKLAELSGLAV